MYNIALHIKTRDWLYILLIGVFFGMFLSSLGYILLDYSWVDGAFFGVIMGFSITFFSLVFISYMNRSILPKLKEYWWLPLSIFFSFLSGFLGTFSGVFLSKSIYIKLIPAFEEQIFLLAVLIGVLTYIVGALLYRFVKMRNHKELVDYEYMQSRLRSLETQLNPHFLFNALNSIAELIHEDKDKAEEAVLKVSAFLRNTMNEKPLISVNDELQNAIDYLELENIRFGGAIDLQVISKVPNWCIPKFSIQLLVENAIKHGYESNMSKLTIYIDFDEVNRVIIVQNDGMDMKSNKFGIGLNNLDQRLQILSGGGLKIAQLSPPTLHISLGDVNENTNC